MIEYYSNHRVEDLWFNINAIPSSNSTPTAEGINYYACYVWRVKRGEEDKLIDKVISTSEEEILGYIRNTYNVSLETDYKLRRYC